jgi:hypothetical protein
VGAEYLRWRISDSRPPALFTTSPPASAGILGRPGTTVLFGDDRSAVDGGWRSGLRLTAGAWLDDCRTIGVEFSYFDLEDHGSSFAAAGTGAPGSPVLARPFFNAQSGREDSEIIALPGVAAGSVRASTSSRLWGAEANGVCNLCCGCAYRVDALAGFRYLDFDEDLAVQENISVLPSVAGLGGSRFAVLDRFAASNDFYGGQVGFRAEARRGRLYGQLVGKVALGDMHEAVDVVGVTRITTPAGAATVRPGGLLALPTNIGHHTRDQFAVVPEGALNVGYQLTDHVRAFVGYTFLYASDVARPGGSIDRVVNPSQLPTSTGPGTLVGPARPAFAFKDADFWAQGVNFGLEFRY